MTLTHHETLHYVALAVLLFKDLYTNC